MFKIPQFQMQIGQSNIGKKLNENKKIFLNIYQKI